MSRDTCEGKPRIETWWLRRHNYIGGIRTGTLSWSSGFERQTSVGVVVDTVSDSPYIRFDYVQTNSEGEQTKYDYRILLSRVPCRFGGKRYYFICPLTKNGVECGRRVGVVYLCGKWFGCRKCHDLAYESQQEPRGGMLGTYAKYWSRSDRSETKQERMRVKFWKGKPTRRYQRLLDHDERFGDFDPILAERELMALLGRNS